MTDSNQKFKPKIIERLEDDWEYDTDSLVNEVKYQTLDFSLKAASNFVIRVIRTPLRSTRNVGSNHQSDELNEYVSLNKPRGILLQQLISIPGKLIFSPLSLLSLFYVSWLHTL